jgi:excisionase family DNA binding protein
MERHSSCPGAPESPSVERAYTSSQAAYVLGVARRTVEDWRWRRRVGLRAVRIGGALRFRESEITRLLDHGMERF